MIIKIERPPALTRVAGNLVGVEGFHMSVREGVIGFAIVPLASVLVLLQAIETRFILRSAPAGVRVLDPPTVIRPRRRAAAAAVPVPDHFCRIGDFRRAMKALVIPLVYRPPKRHAAHLRGWVGIA